MAYSEAHKEATLRYRKNANIVKMVVDVTAEEREKYKAYAQAKGMSLAAYIKGLIEKDIEGGT